MRGCLAGMVQKPSGFWVSAPREDRPGGRGSGGTGPGCSDRPAPWLGGLLLLSLMFMLNATLIFTGTTGMDLYGFYTLDPVATFPLPLVLSTLLNLGMAAAGYACYRWLWRRQASFTGGRWGPFTGERSCWAYRCSSRMHLPFSLPVMGASPASSQWRDSSQGRCV